MAKNIDREFALQFFGAAGTVTGSKFVLSYGRDQILLDCGLFQGLKELRLRNWAPLPFDVKNLNAVILTHAHIDHSGYLPRLVRQGFQGEVYATRATCDLLRVLLPDAAHLQEEEARYANHRGYSKHKPALPLSTAEDAERALRLLRPVAFAREVALADGVSMKLFHAGHILGAAVVRIAVESAGGKRYLIDSGDLGRYGRPILKEPEAVTETDWLLIESTYGDRLHPENPEGELAKIINQVAGEKGCLIIPAFAVGRTQELLYVIRRLEEQGKIPTLPVYMDSPMAVDATEIYCAHPEEHDLDMRLLTNTSRCPLSSRQFRILRTPEESKSINDAAGPLIIISASGMATGGRVLHHLKLRLPDPKTTVLFVGFQAEATRGRTLQQGIKELKLLGEIVPVRAKIRNIDGFSAHADQKEIMRWLGNFTRPPRKTFVVHGEPAASHTLAELIQRTLRWDVEAPTHGQVAVLA